MGRLIPLSTVLGIEESDNNSDPLAVWFRCPGCAGLVHKVQVKHDGSAHPVWEFNSNYEKPTFQPSLLLTYPRLSKPDHTCHSFIRDGRIEFLADCSHDLAGQTIDIPTWSKE